MTLTLAGPLGVVVALRVATPGLLTLFAVGLGVAYAVETPARHTAMAMVVDHDSMRWQWA